MSEIRKVLLLSNSHSGAKRFAEKLGKIWELFNENAEVFVLSGEELLDNIMSSGYDGTGTLECAKARLGLRETFVRDPAKPLRRYLTKQLKQILEVKKGGKNLIIVCEYYDTEGSLEDLGFHERFFLDATEEYRTKEFNKNFPSVSDKDILKFLYPHSYPIDGGVSKLSIDGESSVIKGIMGAGAKLLWGGPTEGVNGGQLGNVEEGS